MEHLLLSKEVTAEEYEIKVIDHKGPPEKSHKERRWKVLFSGCCVAQGFLTKEEVAEYLVVHGYLLLWNTLWTKGIQVNWSEDLHVRLENYAINLKELQNGN